MALSKRRKAEIKVAQEEVSNHAEMIRFMVEGKQVEITVTVQAKVTDPSKKVSYYDRNYEHATILEKTQNISDVRDPYVLRQIRSWLNRKGGQRRRHSNNQAT